MTRTNEAMDYGRVLTVPEWDASIAFLQMKCSSRDTMRSERSLMSRQVPTVPGFECAFLREFEDVGGAVDFSLRFLKQHEQVELCAFEGPSLLLPLEAGAGSLELNGAVLDLGPSSFACVPKGVRATISATSSLLRLVRMTFTPFSPRDEDALQEPTSDELEKLFAQPGQGTRALWFNEVLNRYVFERSVAKRRASLAARFCETELLKEACASIIHGATHDPTCARQRLSLLSSPVRKAVAFIECNLHVRTLDLAALAASASASKSSLQRAFARELGDSPMRYLWSRRLQEARLLLLTGRYGVAEIATHVGYADVSSFSQAYSREFGQPPSHAAGK